MVSLRRLRRLTRVDTFLDSHEIPFHVIGHIYVIYIFNLLKADIDGGQLSIALEPEAASLYCQLLPTEKLLGSEGAKFAVASPGTKYMVIDLGGTVCKIHQFYIDIEQCTYY